MPQMPSSATSSEIQRVVTPHDWFGSELAEVLDQVVDERVVIIDNENPGRHDADASCRPLWRSLD